MHIADHYHFSCQAKVCFSAQEAIELSAVFGNERLLALITFFQPYVVSVDGVWRFNYCSRKKCFHVKFKSTE